MGKHWTPEERDALLVNLVTSRPVDKTQYSVGDLVVDALLDARLIIQELKDDLKGAAEMAERYKADHERVCRERDLARAAYQAGRYQPMTGGVKMSPKFPSEPSHEPLKEMRMRFGETTCLMRREQLTGFLDPNNKLRTVGFHVPNGSSLMTCTEENGKLVFWYYVQDRDNKQEFKKTFYVFWDEEFNNADVFLAAARHVATIPLRVQGLVTHVLNVFELLSSVHPL